MMRIHLLILLLTISTSVLAQPISRPHGVVGKVLFKTMEDGNLQPRALFDFGNAHTAENPRLIAIALNLTLGLFGMHRMYLGTDLIVPIAYTFTIGGGGLLWLTDLILLISTPDISPFMDNPNMFMWVQPPTNNP